VEAADGAMMQANGSTAQKFPRPLPEMSFLPGMVPRFDVDD